MSSMEERLKECFTAVFPNLTSDEILRSSTASVATWDSLATVTLISVIEEEFGVTIAPEEYEYIVSFDLVNLSRDLQATITPFMLMPTTPGLATIRVGSCTGLFKWAWPPLYSECTCREKEFCWVR